MYANLQASTTVSPILQSVTVPIVSKSTCISVYDNLITDGMICAGVMKGGQDACQVSNKVFM